jgi:hypothetical protein
MAIGSGIGASLGIAVESTFNTGVAPDHFYEFNSEGTKYNKNTVVGQGLRGGGLVPRIERRVVTTFGGEGDFEIDLPTRALGLLLSLATGTTPTPTQIGSTGVYIASFIPADITRSFTTQVGVPQYNGTVVPKTLTGCKMTSFELSVGAGDIAKGKFNFDSAGFTTATSLTTPVYPYPAGGNANLFHFAQGSITDNVSTTYANIKDFSLTVDNSLKTDRYNLGSLGAKQSQIVNGFRAISGKVTAEFTDTVLFDKFFTDATAGLQLTFTGATIGSSGSNKELLTITIPAAKFDGDTPMVSGPGVIDVSFGFTVYQTGSTAPFTITTQSIDSTL